MAKRWPILVGSVALACTAGDGGSTNFASHGGTAVDMTDGDDGDDDGTPTGDDDDGGTDDGDGDGDDDTEGPDDGDDDDDGPGSTAGDGAAGSSGPGSDDGGSTAGDDGVASTDDGAAESTDDGGMAGTDYEPCNAGGTCSEPGEVCLQVGVGGFCTTPCAGAGACPPAPAGSGVAATCDFLLGFPDFEQDYCGMTGCDIIANNCPAGMSCTYVVMGLTVCEWT